MRQKSKPTSRFSSLIAAIIYRIYQARTKIYDSDTELERYRAFIKYYGYIESFFKIIKPLLPQYGHIQRKLNNAKQYLSVKSTSFDNIVSVIDNYVSSLDEIYCDIITQVKRVGILFKLDQAEVEGVEAS